MVRIKKQYTKGFTTINNDILNDTELSFKAKGLFSYLWSLPDDWVYYETEVTKHSTDGRGSVRSGLKELEEQGYLKRGRKRNDKGQLVNADWQLADTPMFKKRTLDKRTLEKRTLENRTLLNTNLTNEKLTKEEHTNIYSQAEPDGVADKTKTIIDYLNEKTDSHYKATTPKTKQLVQARLKEGFSVDDFKTVIDKKTATWLKDGKMNKYLRPLTLFGTKFEDYLNEKVKGQPDKNDPYYTERINPMTGQPDPNGLTRYQMDNEYW
ncbi:conserved phage C-terminal domain-containing protein [Limosilactobacillus mucosae]|uniref:conserved phage C-terminal domain-containing protein n=1 Tax=Limosilactobacillus mucosae TaxID=97478 RepID=UPI00233F3A0D|nr:conserved phage C-terminal domain-containing protein [Limosilactobacillus mucosae]MDC2841629.1 conserved phage C-terminal domain-containing protein [Limosilactobacillus mucosae]